MEIKLGELEAKLLYSVHDCGGDAYGAAIADNIKKRIGEDVAMGAIYATLDRLEKKELLKSWWSAPESQRGGRRKRLYEITSAGREALRNYDARFLKVRAGWAAAIEVIV